MPRTQWRDYRDTIDANVLLPDPADIPDVPIRGALVDATTAKGTLDAATNARTAAERTLLDARIGRNPSVIATATAALQDARAQEATATAALQSAYSALQAGLRAAAPAWRDTALADVNGKTETISAAVTSIESTLAALLPPLAVLEMLANVQTAPEYAPAAPVLVDPPGSPVALAAAVVELRAAFNGFRARLKAL